MLFLALYMQTQYWLISPTVCQKGDPFSVLPSLSSSSFLLHHPLSLSPTNMLLSASPSAADVDGSLPWIPTVPPSEVTVTDITANSITVTFREAQVAEGFFRDRSTQF